MTESELKRIEALLRVSAINITRCQQIITRSSALVQRAKQLIEVYEKTLEDKEAAASRSIESSRQAARVSSQLLLASGRALPVFAEHLSTFVTASDRKSVDVV